MRFTPVRALLLHDRYSTSLRAGCLRGLKRDPELTEHAGDAGSLQVHLPQTQQLKLRPLVETKLGDF